MPKSRAVVQCAARSTRSKRSSRGDAIFGPVRARTPHDRLADRFVVTLVGCANLGIGGVAVLLPVARCGILHDLDRRQPLERFVTIHRSNVEPHGSAVIGGDRGIEHPIGDDDVGALRLVESETLGIETVIGAKGECSRTALESGRREHFGESYPFPMDLRNAPTGYALEVLYQLRLRH